MRVLVLDDSLTVRMDLVEAFQAAGTQTTPCATVTAAREALADGSFDVLILDVVLPDGDGVEFLAEVRSSLRHSSTVVLMLSSEAEVKDRIRGLRTGADAYVGKPYDVGYVVAKALDLATARSGTGTEPPILVIDDSVTVCAQLSEVLQAEGYPVQIAYTGEDGLRLAAARRPAAVLVDGSLPGIDGATVVRRMRLDTALRSVPCVLLTGSDDAGAELMALDAGADAFVRKQEDISVAVAKLSALLRRAEPGLGADEAASLMAPKKILAVDDSPTYLAHVSELIRQEGYEVVAARSGEEALELIAVESVDCIMLDLMMPGLGGQETCRRVKTTPLVRDVPVIMLTSTDDRETMIEALAAGADDYISKASEFGVVAARIRAQLRRRQFEDENRRRSRAVMVEQLEQKNRELEAFSYSVSHDLRAPLRSIDGFTQILIETVQEHLDDDGRHYAQRVRSGVTRMSEMIDDMLELSRVGRAELVRDELDLAAIAGDILADLAEREPERSVEVSVSGPLPVTADPRLLRHVLENLLGNAWKFTARNPAARIEVGTALVEGAPAMFVADNGGGFDMKHAEKLFVPFQRLHGEADYPGTGIGLATVQRVIDRHGGRIWAEAEVGKGATFWFTLPG